MYVWLNYNNKLSSSHIVVFTFESESILDCAADPSSHSFHFHFLRPLLPSPFLYYLNVIGLIHDLIIFSHCVFLIYSFEKTLTNQNLNDSRLTNIHSTSWTRLDESFHFLNHVFYTTSATKKWSYNFVFWKKINLSGEKIKRRNIFWSYYILTFRGWLRRSEEGIGWYRWDGERWAKVVLEDYFSIVLFSNDLIRS